MIIAFYIYKKNKTKSTFWRYIFNKKIWISKSSFVDYFLFFFNGFIKIILIAPYVILSFSLTFYVSNSLEQNFGFFNTNIHNFTIIILYTVTLTVINDLVSFLIHYLMHKNKILWEFHKIHHSATSLNPITQYRIHPVELIINNIRSIVIFGFITGIFDYISSSEVNKIIFLGVNIFNFIFYLFGANLRHSHIKLSYPKILEYIFISPYQHQIHHSANKKHYNKNMGSKFAIWDWIFGTLIISENTKVFKFGVGKENEKYDKFWYNIFGPFINIKSMIYKSIVKKIKKNI